MYNITIIIDNFKDYINNERLDLPVNLKEMETQLHVRETLESLLANWLPRSLACVPLLFFIEGKQHEHAGETG